MSDDLNPSNKDYESKFTNPADSPTDKPEFADRVRKLVEDAERGDEAQADDGFSYTGDSTRKNLKEQEGAGGETTANEEENGLYRPDSRSAKGVLAKLDQAKDKLQKSSKGKKIMVGIAGAGSVLGIFALIFLLFMVISGFNVKQVAEVMNIANYSRLHITAYRRTTQLLAEKSLNPNTNEFRVATQGRSLFDRFTRFDPNKVLATMRQADELAFVTKDGTRKRFGIIGRDIPTTELDYIRVGKGGGGGLPEASRRWNPIQNYRQQKEFIKGLEEGLESSEIFRGKSRLFRTKTVNAIIEASDIKLYRWVEQGRKIKTFKDAVLSAYDRTKDIVGKFRGTNPDISDAADDFEDDLIESLDKGAASGADAATEATEGAAKKLKSNPAKAFAGKTSLTVILVTTYCSARDYVNATQENAKEKVKSYKISGALAMSASDQIESGDTTATAVMMEAKRWDGFNQSQRYQEAVGNPDAANMPKDLEKSDAPVPDTDSNLYRFFNGYKTGVERIPVVWAATHAPGGNDALDLACRGISSPAGAILTALAENVLGAVLSAGSGGGATATQQGIIQTLRTGFSTILTREGAKIAARQVATGTAFDIGLFLAVDAGLKMILNQNANPAINETDKQYAQGDLGNKLTANDISYAMGGRDLSGAEVAELNSYVKDRRLAQLHKKPLYERIASLGDPLSPASQTVATLPYSPSSLKSKSIEYATKSLNPIATIAKTTSKVASAALGGDKVYATSADDAEDLGVPTIGWSVSELEKMLEPDYWPLANAKYVEEHESEFNELREKCFKPMTESATLPDDCDREKLSTESAFRYRLYQLDGGNASENSSGSDYNDGLLGSLLDTQEVTADSGGTSSPGSGISGDPLSADSSGTPCASGTEDRGIRDDAYTAGNRIKIRVCEITQIRSGSSESNAGTPFYVQGATGGALVNSVVSGAWLNLALAAQQAGIPLSATSSWRTMAHQEDLCNKNAACRGGSYNAVAKPGRSNHQAGTAIDIDEAGFGQGAASGRTCENPQTVSSATYTWLRSNASRFGIKQYPNESWHWGPSERC